MKKWLSLILCLVTVLSLTACGTKDDTPSQGRGKIPSNSKNQEGAWEFIQFMAGPEAQAIMMKTNAVPNQKSLANSAEFLNCTENYFPKNTAAVTMLAECSSVGDWSYLENGEWVSVWANVLNTDVRNGVMTLDEFFSHSCIEQTNEMLKTYKAKKYTG